MPLIDIAQLRAEFPGRRIDYFPTLDSTMRAAAGLPLGSVVLADEQTAGLGRHGHTWYSEPENGIYCSIVLDPSPVLTLALGLAAAEAIVHSTGIACDLRWPNDVMLDGKKVAGILVQLADGTAVAGIGINVNHGALPTELEATSLRLHAGKEFSRQHLVRALLHSIPSFVSEDTGTILRLFTHASSYVAGRRVVVDQPGGRVEGVTAGLDPAGFLIVRKDDGTETLILAGGVRAVGS
jgi:BirA family transcriptional regulator, biotin operon repressor / biotin---[acetyl-CoA-carboxylase] ligase